MLIKRLSKIGVTLLLAVSFIVPFSFNARADFTTTDSQNLATMKNTTNTISTTVSNIYSRLNTTNSYINNVYNHIVNTTDNILDDIRTYLDTIDTRIRTTIHNDLDTLNSNLITTGTYVGDIRTTLSTISNNQSADGTTLTNTYNLLNNYTNGYLGDIRSSTMIIADNVSQYRVTSDSSSRSITLSSNTTLGEVKYNLAFFRRYNTTITNGVFNTTVTDYYGNLYGMILCKFIDTYNLCLNSLNYGFSNLLLDTEFIANESHLIYQKLSDFKDANHTDILTFKSANHTDITTFENTFKSWWDAWEILGFRISAFRDSMTVSRISTTTYDVPVTFGDISSSYPLQEMRYAEPVYNSQTHQFEYSQTYYYVNMLGRLQSNLQILRAYWLSYFNYLNDNSVANSISNNVAALNTNLTNYSAAEQQIQNRVQNAISTFIPDTTIFSGFVAIAWCSQYLQQVYVALGSYGTVIMIGLLLGVCMQFIGYFRYKY